MKIEVSQGHNRMISLILQIICVIIGIAFYTLIERKILGYVQCRKGPNKPRISGLLVPLADALKLLGKEFNSPHIRNKMIFLFSPVLSLMIAFLFWISYPNMFEASVFKYSILFFLCISSLGVYSLLGSGWRRNRKYSLIGAIRSVAQTISYEICFSLILMHWIIFYHYQLKQLKISVLGVFLFVIILLLFVTSLAETNRSPFDFSEGESELVRGFNTEYRSVSFLMLFLSEYISIVFMSALVRLLFNIRGYLDLFLFLLIWSVGFIWCRGTLPRLRYDQLIYVAWKSFLPLVLCSLSFLIAIYDKCYDLRISHKLFLYASR